MASNYPDEGLPENEGGNFRADLPSRMGSTGHPAHTEARAELRDRETYYAELRFAVHCQSRSIPAPRVALDNRGSKPGRTVLPQRAPKRTVPPRLMPLRLGAPRAKAGMT